MARNSIPIKIIKVYKGKQKLEALLEDIVLNMLIGERWDKDGRIR